MFSWFSGSFIFIATATSTDDDIRAAGVVGSSPPSPPSASPLGSPASASASASASAPGFAPAVVFASSAVPFKSNVDLVSNPESFKNRSSMTSILRRNDTFDAVFVAASSFFSG